MANNTQIKEIIEECIPLIRKLAIGRYAISIGGSVGKGKSDQSSDIDFRLFCEKVLPDSEEKKEVLESFHTIIAKWKSRAVEIDGCWIRTVAEIEQQLSDWDTGEGSPIDKIWAVWGYYLLTDITNQYIIEDPFDMIRQWQKQLSQYPEKLKKAVLDKHIESVKYWRNDYHYINKIKREDVVFLSSLSVKLVHDLIQIIFAINNTYYVGDGYNLDYIKEFKQQPPLFIKRVKSALYPSYSEDMYIKQRDTLVSLIDDVLKLVQLQKS